ncbi:MAG: AAA family ATPase [Marinilabiliaceae bacterium]|nr:AAA family ATPase [Marinilabiliaceae bacterium]
MYKRKIEQILLDWKNSSERKPLVIKGCRQCGKTSSVLAFAKKNYAHVIYLNFHEHREYKTFFSGALDIETITLNISVGIKEAKFIPNKTCIVFDEIQDCPNARASLKFFKLDGRFDVLCTGSLLGVNGYKTKEEQEEEENASIPVGYEKVITMYPMDFEEWLWANGIEQQHIEYLRQCLIDETQVNEAVHQRMRQLLLRYVVVGGMPEAVSTFFNTNNMNEVYEVQQNIIEAYKADMLKYALQADKSRIRECFDSIPAQLAKENKKFQYSVIQKNARARDYQGCLQWIEDAGIINRCYNTTITELPLSGNIIPDTFKVYMADIGLLVSMLEQGTVASIMQGNMYTYRGAIFENLMADILTKMGRKLYYFQKSSGLEIDFLIRYNGECVPLECKARTGNAKSMKTILAHPEKYHIEHALKVGDYNVGREGALLTLPFYMGFLLTSL